MTRRMQAATAGIAAVMLGAGSLMAGDRDDDRGRHNKSRFFVSAELVGYQEVPAISTTARGHFRAWVDSKGETITFRLTYEPLEGDVQQAHVHFGQLSVNGGISFFLCSNLGNGPDGTQPCPVGPAEVTGTITPAQIIGPSGTGIEPGAFAEIVAAIRNGTAYANVHSSKWPAGEIRGQLRD